MELDVALLQKLERFCNYQERCIKQVQLKAQQLGLDDKQIPLYINELLRKNLINEKRFICAFIRGKQNLKGWGKSKIMLHLQKFQVDLQMAESIWADEIDHDGYTAKLEKILHKKLTRLANASNFEKRMACMRLAYNKGYDASITQKVLANLGL